MMPVTGFPPLPAFAQEAAGGLTHPQGFLAAGVASGVKKRGKPDLGILASAVASVSATTFTMNAAAAALVRLTCGTSDCAQLRAVVVNAGNAKACTDKLGLAGAARMRLLAANHLRLPVEQVAVSSTGLIDVHLPMAKIDAGIGAAAQTLSAADSADFAMAIRTNDEYAKFGALDVPLAEGVVHVGLAAKGRGMISPKMVTMLCFVTCDAVVAAESWDELMPAAGAASTACTSPRST
ncbi:MAG: bifunctional ornithine acetyltransferase/N-acetylglutamate synthase [Actinobacteria bacterium]|nr:bifunctional ornithine acetyltransferase/N-acetylglutamate synthase [Actinomycetota bacterium]